ncbi:MAG: hypothetical protein PVG54_20075, partial [Anaerolineae bacterium]
MKKRIRILVLLTMLPAILLIPAGPVISKVGPDALANCQELAFSTEEDFVTKGPEPADGNPIISDGDLLGITHSPTGAPTCAICARNADLLEGTFDVSFDLGLDAADVINIDGYLVAFSTELDSPNNTGALIQFTAGDLLITNGAIIPNQALTAKWSVGYDLGLDAVQFVGKPEDILTFLDTAVQYDRDDWLANPGTLADSLTRHNIDIWFSTEGTLGPVDKPVFLDGDLLSARDGTIKASNSALLPVSVPAGIVDRGVDFGLDAVTNDRSLDVNRRINFSTEILFERTPSFTDGDVLQYGNGVVATNFDLVGCFLPEAKELGLDALSAGVPEAPPECISRITDIAGVDVGDISPTDGMAHPGTVGSINAPVPFGGWLDISGTICDDVDEYRVVYRKSGTADSWKPIPVPSTLNWQVKADAFIPWGPDCLGSMHWYSNPTTGWYGGGDYRHLTESSLGGCNPGLALTVWESAAVPTADGGPEALYDLVLETKTTGGTLISDTVRLVQLDNTAPETHLKKEAGVCNTVTSMPLMIEGRIKDDHFHSYQLRITGDGYGTHSYPVVEYYDLLDPGATNLTATGTLSWPNNVQLHEVDLTDLHD